MSPQYAQGNNQVFLQVRNRGRVPLNSQSSFTIGRSSQNDIAVPDEKVSRHHARLEWQNERLYLVDLNSSHGTLVNGQPITQRRLQNQDTIQIGNTMLTLVMQEGAHIAHQANIAMPLNAPGGNQQVVHVHNYVNAGAANIQQPSYARPPRPNDNSGYATIALIVGIFALFAWLLPICGFPLSIVGLVFASLGQNSFRRGQAVAGRVMCIIGLVGSIFNSIAGVLMYM